MTAQANVKTDTLLELAERCEQATQEQEEGMLRRAFIFGVPQPAEPHYQTGENRFLFTPEYAAWTRHDSRFRQLMSVKAFLDAAMTLVPEGTSGRIGWCDGAAFADLDDTDTICGPTLPLALCAAALRARAA